MFPMLLQLIHSVKIKGYVEIVVMSYIGNVTNHHYAFIVNAITKFLVEIILNIWGKTH